jgi:sporulation protein YabP
MEERQQQQVLKGHRININARKTATITGVNDVLSFDAGEVLLQTEQGILMIRGNELHVNRLTLEKGEVDIDGRIDSLTYSETAGQGKSSESLFGRLFK